MELIEKLAKSKTKWLDDMKENYERKRTTNDISFRKHDNILNR